MKANLKTISLFALAAVLASCSGKWNQDPLKDFNKDILNGQHKPQKPVTQKPEVGTDTVVVDSDESYTFSEAKSDKIQFKVRVFRPNYTASIEIDNLGDFPGATFDKATGIFAWTPAKGFVGPDKTRELYLTVTGVATPAEDEDDQVSRISKKNIKITVSRDLIAPSVLSVEANNTLVHEGDSIFFEVEVKDTDAKESDVNSYPKLEILSGRSGKRNLAPFVTEKSIAVNNQGNYVFKVELNLKNVELTGSSDEGSFLVKAKSRYSQLSNSQEGTVKVYTKLEKPVSDITEDEVLFTVGQAGSYSFKIFDPKFEGSLEITTNTAASEPVVTCEQLLGNVSYYNCTATWTPTDVTTSPESIRIQVTSNNKDQADYIRQYATFVLNYKAVAASMPQPQPQP